MTPEQLEGHQQLLAHLAKMNELMAAIQEDPDGEEVNELRTREVVVRRLLLVVTE